MEVFSRVAINWKQKKIEMFGFLVLIPFMLMIAKNVAILKNNFISNTKEIGNKLNRNVHLSSMILKKEVITERIDATNVTDKKMKIMKCIFHECSSANENGGAIQCCSDDVGCFVQKSGFFDCFTLSSGGAIFASCNETELIMTCFYDTFANKSGQSVEINASIIMVDQMIIFNCGPEEKNSKRTASFIRGFTSIQNSNISSNRQVDRECGVSLVDCETLIFRLNMIEKHKGNGLFFVSYDNELSCFEQCNVVNNTTPVNSSAFTLVADGLLIRKFVFVGNSFSRYFSFEKGDRVTLNECKFDHDESGMDEKSSILQKNCKYKIKNIHLNNMTIPQTMKCFALNSPDSVPTTATPTQSIAATESPSPSIEEVIAQTMTETVPIEWMPKGMFFIQYWLILYAAIITPIFVIIHCVTTRSVRTIKALN